MSHKPDPVEALHADLLASKEGIAGAARHIGRSPQVLYNKFSDSMPLAELTGREERALAEYSHTDRYIQACCAYFGGVFLRVPQGMAGDDDLFDDYLKIIKEMGDLSKEFIKAKEDDDIDRGELNRLTREGYDVIAAIQRFLLDMETRVVDRPERPSLQAVR